MGHEQRRDKRFSIAVPAKVQIVVPEETFSPMLYEGEIRNLSRGGLMVIAC